MHFAFLLLKLTLSLLIYLTNSRKFLFLQHVLHFVFSSSSRSPSSEATAPETGPGSTQQRQNIEKTERLVTVPQQKGNFNFPSPQVVDPTNQIQTQRKTQTQTRKWPFCVLIT
jgi:hypothetical protein